MSLLTRKQQWRRCRHKRRAESCDASLYDDLLKALNAPADRQLHKVASAPELHTLSQAKAVEQAQAAAGFEAPATTSFSESEVLPPLHRQKSQKRKVRFAKVVAVVLIPTRKEYEEIKLNQELWWSDDDYFQFKASAMEEYIRHLQKKQRQQEKQQQKQLQQAMGAEPEAPTEEQSPEQRRSMKHVDSIVLTQSQQTPEPQEEDNFADAAADAAVDELFFSDCHTDGSTEASSVDEHDDPEQPISECGSQDAGEQQKPCSASDSDSIDCIHHLDSLELQTGCGPASKSIDGETCSSRKASVAGFQELEEFLRQHAASYEWRCIPHSQQAVMI